MGPAGVRQASNTNANDTFGSGLALSSNGSTLAVGAALEDSKAIGLDGDQSDNSSANSGAAYVLTRNGTTWSHKSYVKATNTDPADQFGYGLSLSGDGLTLAASAPAEDSSAVGVDGDQSSNATADSGAAYVYR